MSRACEPLSATRPRASAQTRVARRTVLNRCAIVTQVRPALAASRASCTTYVDKKILNETSCQRGQCGPPFGLGPDRYTVEQAWSDPKGRQHCPKTTIIKTINTYYLLITKNLSVKQMGIKLTFCDPEFRPFRFQLMSRSGAI